MEKQPAIEAPIISQALRNMGAPVSAVSQIISMIYTRGMPPIDSTTGAIFSGDTLCQVRASLVAIQAALLAVDCSFSQVVKVTIYVAGDVDMTELNNIYREFFTAPYPSRSVLHVSAWQATFTVELSESRALKVSQIDTLYH